MKRPVLTLLISILAILFASMAAFAVDEKKCGPDHPNHLAGFTCPILTGGEDIVLGANHFEASRKTNATHLKFISHEENGQWQNFNPDYSVGAPDIVATPGAKYTSTTENAAGFYQLPTRSGSGLNSLNGIGPSDFVADDGDGNSFVMKLDMQSAGGAKGNVNGRRLIIGDVRELLNPNEFTGLFGKDPLEEGLIGNAGFASPYFVMPSTESYPTAPFAKSDNKFQFCMPSGGMPYYWSCDDDRPPVGAPYDDVYLYDLAIADDLIVTASYDPFIMKVKASGHGSVNGTEQPGQVQNDVFATYISPLTFFAKDASTKQYRFLGYTSWEWPDLQVQSSANDLEFLANLNLAFREPVNRAELQKALYSNPWLPIAANPIAVDVMKHKDGNKMFAVTYQNTLFDIKDWILNTFGRPMTFPKGLIQADYYRFEQLLGRKEGGSFIPIQDDTAQLFPSGIISPVIFWKQTKALDPSSYEGMNPSHVFDPYLMVLVSPGSEPFGAVYDAAVVTDFKGTSDERQLLLVPSSKKKTDDKYAGLVYIIDPNDETRNLWMKSWKISPSKEVTEVITEMPDIKLPLGNMEVNPKAGMNSYIPYQIRTTNVDGDACEDFTITWRGYANTLDAQGNAQFTNESSWMFAPYFTIVLRKKKLFDDKPICIVNPSDNIHVDMPNSGMVSSVAIGDVDNDGIVEIVAGNLKLEMLYDSFNEYASHAYVIEIKKDINGKAYADVMGAKKMRVGFEKFDNTKKNSEYGAGYVEVSGNSISVINGRPLMLPAISCPNYDDQTIAKVGSVYETLSSAMYIDKTPDLNKDFAPPFFWGDEHIPMPARCVERNPCSVQTGKFAVNLPLWEGECPTTADKLANANLAYKYLCLNETTPKVGVGYVNCQLLFDEGNPDYTGDTYNGQPGCGNGLIDLGEHCDKDPSTEQMVYAEGVDSWKCDKDSCEQFCQCPKCGNNELEYGEQCDLWFKGTSSDGKTINFFLIWGDDGELGTITKDSTETETLDHSSNVDPNKCQYCYQCHCMPKKPMSSNDKKDAETSSGSGTEFASKMPDAVYSSDRGAIAKHSETIPAGDTDEPPAETKDISNVPKTLTGYFYMQAVAMKMESEFKLANNSDAKKASPASCTLTPAEVNGLTKVKLPHGAVMPGHREITAVIPYKKAEPEQPCGNNELDPPPEDCDTKNGSLVHQPELEGCTECTPECRCLYGTTPTPTPRPTPTPTPTPTPIADPIPCGNNLLNAGEECDAVNGKVESPNENCICVEGCKCTYPENLAELPTTAPTEIQAVKRDCFVSCDDFSTNEYKEYFEKLNEDYYRSVTGRKDYYFCEMGRAKVFCIVPNAYKSVTADGETKSVASPYMITQDGGFRPDPPETESKVQDFFFMRSPERIIPIAGPATSRAATSAYTMPTLPDLSNVGDIQIIKGGIEPMAAELVIHGADGTTIINNMVKHKMDGILPENFQFKGQQVAASGSGPNTALHTLEYIIPYFAIFSTVIESGQQMRTNLEEQGLSFDDFLIENQPTPEDVRAFLEDVMAKGKEVNSGITYEAPWAKHMHYKFSLISQLTDSGDAASEALGAKAATAGEGEIAPSSLATSQFSFAAADIVHTYGGSQGCNCRMTANDDIDLKALLALMAFILITSGGVAAVRVVVHIRRRRR